MRALTIQQPNASLLAVGATSLLTSHRFTTYRGPVAIYAHWWFPLRDAVLLKQRRYREALSGHYFGDELAAGYLPTGAFIAVGRLASCFSTNDPASVPPLDSDDSYFNDFTADRYAWQFDQVRRLELPIKCHGQRFFWTLPHHIHEQLAAFV